MSEIVLDDFSGLHHVFVEQNDPVMGGRSTGVTQYTTSELIFKGSVVDVPSLQAPGFIKTTSSENGQSYPDLRSCTGLTMSAYAIGPQYDGFRFSFSQAHPIDGNFFSYGYKTNIAVSSTPTTIVMPFNTFTDKWSDSTGEPITTCQQNSRYCPSAYYLQHPRTFSIWAEGKAGDIELHIQNITAYGC